MRFTEILMNIDIHNMNIYDFGKVNHRWNFCIKVDHE